MKIEEKVVRNLAILKDDKTNCPICNRPMQRQITRCRFFVKERPRIMFQEVLFCDHCHLHFGNEDIVQRIERKYARKSTIVYRMPVFYASNLTISEVRKIMYDENTNTTQPFFIIHGVPQNKNVQKDNRKLPVSKEKKKLEPFIKKISERNTQKCILNLYPVPVEFKICPICKRTLVCNYIHAIKIDSEYCVSMRGSFCDTCDAFFSTDSKAIDYLEKHNSLENYCISNEFCRQFNVIEYAKKTMRRNSLYLQFYLLSDKGIKVVQIVYNKYDENIAKDRLFYMHKEAMNLLIAKTRKENTVVFFGEEFTIVNIKTESHVPRQIRNGIEKEVALENDIRFNQPSLSSKSILYVYQGRIKCHLEHHVVPYRAKIYALDCECNFFINYCFNCKRFIMKYDDYSSYLRRFGFFPIRIKITGGQTDEVRFYNRADMSPLRLQGYTVRADVGLTDEERQRILSYVMDCHILSKRKVLDYLELFIRESLKRPNRELAISKWTADKEFVLDYKLPQHPLVVIGEIKPWK